MNLIKTTDELKRYFSSIDKDYRIASLQSFLEDVERDILEPYFGSELVDIMTTAYQDNTLTADQLKLLPYLQKAVTHLSLMQAADSGSFRISDSGFYVVSTASNKPVSDKKMAEFRKGRRESGYLALEQAGVFLEKNIDVADFLVYKTSQERLQHIAAFINTATEFTRYYRKLNNSAFLFSQLTDALDRAERRYLEPVLGIDYFDELKEKQLDGSFTDAEKKLLPYVKRALAQFTMAEGLPGLMVDFDGASLVISSQPAYGNSENVESKSAAKAEDIARLAGAAMAAGQMELKALQDYLIAHADELAGYTPPESTDDVNINDPNSPTFFV